MIAQIDGGGYNDRYQESSIGCVACGRIARFGKRIFFMKRFPLWLVVICLSGVQVAFADELPDLAFPDKARLDNVDLLDDYAFCIAFEKSGVSNEEKAIRWKKFARKWRKEAPFSKQAKKRAIEWNKLEKRQLELSRNWQKLKRLIKNENLGIEVRRGALAEFMTRVPSSWEYRPEVEAAALSLGLAFNTVPSKTPPKVTPAPEGTSTPRMLPVPEGTSTATPPTESTEELLSQTMAQEETVPAVESVQSESLPVLDFCGIKKGDGTKSFVRQRLMVLAVAGAEIFLNGETDIDGSSKVNYLKGVDASQLFANMFKSYVPLKRFDTVLAANASPEAWKESDTITMADIRAKLTTPFDQYSASCSDYLVVAYVNSYKAKWSEAEVTNPKTNQKEKIPSLSLNAKGLVRIFKRSKDGFDHLADLKATSGGLIGFAAGFAGKVSGAVGDPTGVADSLGTIGAAKKMSFVSLRPTADCQVPENPTDGVAALRCAGILDSLPELPGPPGMGEASKEYCKDFDKIRTREGAAVCAVRKAGELYAVSAQKKARAVDGWRLYAEISSMEGTKDGGSCGFVLGDAEGVERGMGFYAVRAGKDGNAEKVGYVKVTQVGPGGAQGAEEMSQLGYRINKPELGIRLEEHPLVGFTVGIAPTFFFPLIDRKNIVLNASGDLAKYPPVAMGAELEVGYDLTRSTFSELWVRYRMGFGVAPVSEYKYHVVNMQVGPEARLFMFNRSYWFFAFTGNMTISGFKTYNDLAGSPSQGSVVKGSGTVGGMEFRTGMDVMFNADFYLRLSVGWMQNFARVEYKDDKDNRVFDRKDNPSGLQMGLTLNYTI